MKDDERFSLLVKMIDNVNRRLELLSNRVEGLEKRELELLDILSDSSNRVEELENRELRGKYR
jgi:hypothetical protein